MEGNTDLGIQDTEVDITPVKFRGLQPGHDATKDVRDAGQKEDVREPPKDRTISSHYERPNRKAAMKNRENIQEMISTGILKVNKTEIPKTPTHAWNWYTFRDLVEDGDDITIVSSMVDPVAEDVSSDETPMSSGNDSPVQTPKEI